MTRESEKRDSEEQAAILGGAGVPSWVKVLVTLCGLGLVLPMPVVLLGYCCIGTAPAYPGGALGLVTAIFVGVVCGGGMLRHGAASLEGKPSRPLRLPPVWALVGGFIITFVVAMELARVEWVAHILAPWFIVAAAALIPLTAVAWAVDSHPEGVTWRRALVAFSAGATVSSSLALILGWLIPYFILWGILDLGEPIRRAFERLMALLAGREVARALTDPFFLLAMVQYAIAAPLIEEFTKSLVILPLVRRISRREGFLLGVAAGAGFAFLEDLVYTAGAGARWSGTLATRALGAAVHPLCTGMAVMAWHALLRPDPEDADRATRRRHWARWFGMALAAHGVWNGSILIWSVLSGTPFFGETRYTWVVGTSIAVGLLALLAVEGAAAAWGIWALSRRLRGAEVAARRVLPEMPVERAIALWAVVCLLVLLPLGLALLR